MSAGEHFDPAQMFSTAHAESINTLQLLMKALTQLQRAAQSEGITAALQVGRQRTAQCATLLVRMVQQPWVAS